MKKQYTAPQINNVELSIEEMVLSCCKTDPATTMRCSNGVCITGPSTMANSAS